MKLSRKKKRRTLRGEARDVTRSIRSDLPSRVNKAIDNTIDLVKKGRKSVKLKERSAKGKQTIKEVIRRSTRQRRR